jgi:Fe-S-cluster formation regulator IscX/YfhJ
MTAQTEYPDAWQYAENAPEYASAVSDLWHWSTNYDAGRGPITLFLDLIGWSDENIGEKLYDMNDMSLGYVELHKLALALTQYSDRPQDVTDWIDGLLAYDEA